MISAGIEGRLPYMTYSEPWSRNPPKQPPEVFLRPAPKLLPSATRCTQEPSPIFLPYRSYNGVNTTTYPNGTRIAPSRPISKYPSPPPSAIPVNLTQPKDEIKEDTVLPYSYRIFEHSPQFTSFPYPTLCQQPYMLRTPPFPPTPLSPQEIFSPGTPTASSTATFLSPPATFSPPSIVKTSQGGVLRDKRTSPVTPTVLPAVPHPQSPSFKVPSGKEGSMKHRILTRPEDALRNAPLDLQKPPEGRRRLAATISPPRSPKRHLNNNTVPENFQKGQLIQLANGDFKKIEDMRTEDFVQSAEKSPALRLAESTVVKIDEGKEGHVTIALTYDQRRAQVEVDSTPEHPYFVMGQGWASYSPDRTLQCYGLKVHRLQVGDILVSLTPRDALTSTHPSISTRSTTIMTTATTTAMSARQYPVNSSNSATNSTNSSIQCNPFAPPFTSPQSNASSRLVHNPHNHRPLSHSPPKSVRSPEYILSTTQPLNYYCASSIVSTAQQQQTVPLQLDAESRKRRWSAPDAIEDDELARRSRVE